MTGAGTAAVAAEWARTGDAECPGMWTQAIRTLRKDANPGWRDYRSDVAGAASGVHPTGGAAAVAEAERGRLCGGRDGGAQGKPPDGRRLKEAVTGMRDRL